MLKSFLFFYTINDGDNMNPLKDIDQMLLPWYFEKKRVLPWRENHNPYRIWISEVMLQQTRVEAVISYFNRFTKKLPSIYDLAQVDDDTLFKLWEGLGYYNRARNMKKMAQIVVEQYHGQIPSTYEEMIKLPGIGPYTAGAILSIAYQKKYACVDGNVLRVIHRYLGDFSNIEEEQTKKRTKQLLEEILPEDVSSFNQSLMELGALICLPNGKPLCTSCPLNKKCIAYLEQKTEIIPVKNKKKERKKESYTFFLLHQNDKYFIEKRKEQGLLASLYGFLNVKETLSIQDAKKYIESLGWKVISIQKLPSKKHIFTHIEWEMLPYLIETEQKENSLFVTKKEMKENYSIPTAMQKLIP